MRLTSFTDLGMRALMRMASAPDRAFSTAEMADEFRISRHHLTKIMQKLSRAGFVVTRRGSGGGAMLARPPHEISLGDVIRLLESGQTLVECMAPDGGNCTLRGRCGLKSRLFAAQNAFYAELDRSTLADIALSWRTSQPQPVS